MTYVEAALLVTTFLVVAFSAFTDIRTRKIKNWVTLPAIVLGLAVHAVAFKWDLGQGLGLKWSLLGLVIGALPFLVMNTIDSRAFGMGDVKLMAAVGALLGWPMMLEVLLYVALAGGVVAVAVLIRRRVLRRTLSGMLARQEGKKKEKKKEEGSEDHRSQYIPYGVAIAGGTVLVLALEISRKGIF